MAALCGDFNTRIDRPEDGRTTRFVDTLSELGFWIPNDSEFATYRSPLDPSTIDLFATNLDLHNILADRHSLKEGRELT